MIIFEDLPLEISVIINDYVNGQEEFEKNRRLILTKFIETTMNELAINAGMILIRCLLANTSWGNISNQTVKTQLIDLPEDAKETDIQKIVELADVYYLSHTKEKKVHRIISCAYHTEETRRTSELVDKSEIGNYPHCRHCMKGM